MINTIKSAYTLSNGVTIPQIGFGTWQTKDGQTAVDAVKTALDAGYRHIDTAAAYGNEASVGQAIVESGIDRQELFVTTKLWNTQRGYNTTLNAFEESLRKLGFDYLDLYLIHWPANAQQFSDWQTINADTWRAFETLYTDGRIKAIGVSNFLPHHLDALAQTATVAPMVNQIEYHPGFTQAAVVDYCNAHDILVQAWSPLGTGKLLNDETLTGIARNYGKSVAQVCIRWCLQTGTLPLPKSVTPARIRENLDVLDFTLTDADVQTIDQLPYIGGSGLNPDTVAF